MNINEIVEKQGWSLSEVALVMGTFIAVTGLAEVFTAFAAEMAADENAIKAERGE